MEQADLRSWERQCTQDDMPKCRAACPLQMDVRPFLERMAHGDTPGARKVLERHLPLPGVLGRICEHPCVCRSALSRRGICRVPQKAKRSR